MDANLDTTTTADRRREITKMVLKRVADSGKSNAKFPEARKKARQGGLFVRSSHTNAGRCQTDRSLSLPAAEPEKTDQASAEQ